MARLLIVDNERTVRESLRSFLSLCGYQVEAAESGASACSVLARQQFDLVFADFRLATTRGMQLLTTMKRHQPGTLTVLMTAYAMQENAIAAARDVAYDYVTKPFTLEQIRSITVRALQLRYLQDENRELRVMREETPLLEARSVAMSRLLESARQAALSNVNILLSGESGTGKNVLARQIHRWSNRRNRPFVTVNCSTRPEGMLESELFGRSEVSGGGVKDNAGRLEAADHGTVFLDEVADLPASIQSKLVRFVEDRCFESVGGDRTIQVDVRLIAASSRDLAAEVSAHHFRKDLFYRLNVVSLRIPPLRERREDILPLCEWLLQSMDSCAAGAEVSLSPAAAAAVNRYHWPGNLRELRNTLVRAVTHASNNTIQADDLPKRFFCSRHPVSNDRRVPVTHTNK